MQHYHPGNFRRLIENNEYEVISGHRRLHACKKAGIEMIPALIYAMNRDAAAIAMVDSNLLRESRGNRIDKISFRTMDIRKYFPKSYDSARIQAHIIKLPETDYHKRQRAQER